VVVYQTTAIEEESGNSKPNIDGNIIPATLSIFELVMRLGSKRGVRQVFYLPVDISRCLIQEHAPGKAGTAEFLVGG
jgi:hypothetical protein